MSKRLVLMVEGEGDVQAVPGLISKLILQLPSDLQSALFVDSNAMRVKGINAITGRERSQQQFQHHLLNAGARKNLGGVLLLLDGDEERVEGIPFCARDHARTLAIRAKAAGAGNTFSFAAVFLLQEYESLLIACADQLQDMELAAPPPILPEVAPRDAKGWLKKNRPLGYNPTVDQATLTQQISDWQPARALRSFRRLENAIAELFLAVHTDQHISTPVLPPPVETATPE